MGMGSGLEYNELDVKALEDLLEVARALKESGLLGMLKEILANTESLMEGMQMDLSTFRLGLLLGAILEASRRLDGEEAVSLKMNTEDASFCLFRSLATTKPGEVEPKGMMGLMSALRDSDVQKGIGYLIAIAKNLGGCLKQLK